LEAASPVAPDLPFRIDPTTGQVVVTTDVNRQIRQRLIGIIGTNPGERVMRPRIGVGVARMVFEPDPAQVTAELSVKVSDQAAQYEPSVHVRRIIPYPNARKGEALLDVEYVRRDTPSAGTAGSRYIHRAAIGAGGVIAEVRGG